MINRAATLALVRATRQTDVFAELEAAKAGIAAGNMLAQHLRHTAWLHAACEDFSAAEACLRRAQGCADDRGEAFFAAGLLRLTCDDSRAARACFIAAARALFPPGADQDRICAELAAYDPKINRFSALSIFYDFFSNAFCCFLLVRPVLPAEHQSYEFCVSRTCIHLGLSQATMNLLEVDHRVNGSSLWYHANSGHFCWLQGQRAAADAHYAQARMLSDQGRLTPYHVNCGVLAWLDLATVEGLLRGEPAQRAISTHDWAYCWADAAPRDLVVVVGCDSGYFRFFPKFLLSVIQSHAASAEGQRVAVHCHLADATDEQIQFLQRIGAEVSQAGGAVLLSYSTNAAQFKDRSYYTCLRFLALPEILSHYQCPALVMDIDSILDIGFFKTYDAMKSCDFALRMYSFSPETWKQLGDEPWSIGAHPTYLSATAIGQRFAAFISAYICKAYDPAHVTNWTIDQCAIAQAYDLIVRRAPAASVLNLAFSPSISHLPSGSKDDFLVEGGLVDFANFSGLAALGG